MIHKMHLLFILTAVVCIVIVVGHSRPSSGLVKHSTTDRCTNKKDQQGFCVQSYLCQDGNINTQGDDLLDERGRECESPKVCCVLSEQIKMTSSRPTASTLVPGIVTPSMQGQHCTAGDTPGRCLYPHLCKNDSTVLDGSDLLDERSVDPCPLWRGAVQICCPNSRLPPNLDDIDSTTQSSRTGKDEEDPDCSLSTGPGKCVLFYQCIGEDEDGSNIINVRYNGEGQCPYTKKCCPVSRVDKTQKPVTPTPPSDKNCGMANKNGLVYQIFAGRTNEAKFGQYPWMVAVRTRTGPGMDNYNTTGGSIIHPSVVLTAAHYVVRAVDQDVRARAGEWDTLTMDEPFPHQERQVRKIVAHPEFKNRNKHHDIGLLFLHSPFELSPHVGVVCLPPAERVAPTTECVANGWGKDKFGSQGKIQNILKETILPVVDRTDCQTSLRNTRLGPFFQLHEGFMCAGGKKLDTCTQDGGSPLACTLEQEPDRYMVWGIVSWGIGCGQDGVPGVYVDVSQYLPWIKSESTAEGFNVEEYDS